MKRRLTYCAAMLALLAPLTLVSAVSSGASSPSSPNNTATTTAPSAKFLISTAMHNAEGSSWVHEEVALIYKGKIVVAGVGNESVLGSTENIKLENGGYADLVALDNQKKVYEKADSQGYTFAQPSPKVPSADYNKWILLTPGDPNYNSSIDGSSIPTEFRQYHITGTLSVGPLTTLDGVKVWPVHGTLSAVDALGSGPGVIYVTADGKEWPMAMSQTYRGVTEARTWTAWNTPAVIRAPSGAISGAGL